MLEDHLDVKLDSKQVAEAFGVKQGTVSSWVAQKRLTGKLPRKARRLGRKFTVQELLLFTKCQEDDGASEQQFREWWEENKKEVLDAITPRISSTPVLSYREDEGVGA